MPDSTPLRGSVPSSYVLLLYDHLRHQGYDATVLLGQPPPSREDTPGRTPITEWKRLLERAAAALDDPALGLRLGQQITPAYFGLMGYVLLACPHLGAALQRLRDFERLFYDVSPLRVQYTDDALVLEWGTENGRPGVLVDEAAISALVHMARDVTGQPQISPSRIDFVNAASCPKAAYAEILGCAVHFEQSATRVHVPLTWLAQPLRQADPQLLQLLQQQAAEQLRRLPPRGALSARIRDEMPALLQQGAAHADAVAQRLHLSPRSLHRQLAREGLRFGALRDECLHQLACDYLADWRLQLSEIAQLLGYSEQSAFTRAFRRWHGCSPHQYRKQLRTEAGPGI
ncbi:MAG: AraC family transcriptional regulator ligand-binding domain-containing protein [Algiphilus sp.]|uniref:AraC family transcriptional regulator n=1 Tax=Algiphilus sp. TaxID=1872431 RepID=UPI0032EDFF41